MRKNKPQNLNEQLSRMKRLMSFDIGEHSHDKLTEQEYKKIVTEQKNPGVTTKKQDIKTNMGSGKVGAPEQKKVSDEDISNMGKDIMSDDIKEILAKKDTSITDDQADRISASFIDRALVDKKYGKMFKTGLVNDSLHLNVWETYQQGMFYGNVSPTKSQVITLKGDGKEAPKLKVWYEDMTNSKEFGTDDELSAYVNNLNIDLFSKGSEDQYFLYTVRDGKVIHAKGGEAFMMAKRPSVQGTTTFMNLVGPTSKGGATPGETIPGEIDTTPVDFTIKMTEPFEVEKFNLQNPEQSKQVLLDKITKQLTAKGIKGLKISEINIISSASNSWANKWVTPTHKGNTPYTAGDTDLSGKQIENVHNNFNTKPDGSGNEGKNNVLAWNRGGTIGNLVKSVHGEHGIDTQSAKINVQWRVTDTKGQTDEQSGHEGAGQFAVIQIKGDGEITTEKPSTETPGKNVGAITQRLIYLTSMEAKGGKRTISWFSAHKAKYIGKGGKPLAKPRTTGGISGLPYWLDKIIGYQ